MIARDVVLRRTQWALACACVALPVCAPSLQAQAADAPAQGWSFTYTAKVSAAARGPQSADIAFDVTVWRGVARVTPRSGPLAAMTGDGGMILLRAADTVLSIVNVARKDELRLTLTEFGGVAGGMGPMGANIPITVRDVSARVQPRGSGTPLGGFATRRAEVTGGYTLEVTSPAGKRTIRMDQRQVVDVSRDVDRLDPGFRAFAEQFVRGLGVPAAARRQLRAQERGMPPGFPVRSTTSAVTISGADTLRSERVAEISAPRRVSVDTTDFVVPAGFRVTEMSRLLQQRPRRP